MNSAADTGVEPALPAEYGEAPRALPPPPFALAPGVTLEHWRAGCAASDCATQAVSACFRAETGGYAEEVDGLIHDKLAEIAASTSARAGHDARLREVARVAEASLSTRSLTSEGARARTMTAFSESPSALHACFALCSGSDGDAPSCDRWMQNASISGSRVPRPSASAGLTAAVTAVHHPRATLAAGFALVCCLFLAAIVLRPSPRRTRALGGGRGN